VVDINDPRPVLRQELAKVFKNQRVIRAFEKIFDLIPPEFIDQQEQLDAINVIAELAGSKATEAVDTLARLANAVEQLSMAPTPIDTLPPDDVAPRQNQYSDLVNLTSYPALDNSIVVTWTGLHTFSANANVTGTLAVTGIITSSGNINVGASTNVWGTGYKSVDLVSTGAAFTGAGYQALVGCNTYFDGTNWIQVGALFGPSSYTHFDGVHHFFGNAPGGAGSTYTPRENASIDRSTTATHTRFLVYDVDTATLARVTVGAANSGGAGFKLLRIPN
jgi:hypothetical protein